MPIKSKKKVVVRKVKSAVVKNYNKQRKSTKKKVDGFIASIIRFIKK